MKAIRGYILLCIILPLAGCATQQINSQNVDQMIEAFKSGKIQLSGSIVTAGNDAFYSDTMIQDYNSRDWSHLAKLVIEANTSNDFSWFLLGRSAEGLGYDNAAFIYYKNSINAEIKDCFQGPRYISGECHGVILPDWAVAHLQNLMNNASQ